VTSAPQRPRRRPEGGAPSPGTTATAEAEAVVLGAVREIVTQVHSAELGRSARLDSSLDRDLGLASLELVELLSRLEELFDVHLPSTLLGQADSPRDLANAVLRATPSATSRRPESLPTSPAVPGFGVPEQALTLLDALDWHASATPDRSHLRVLGDEGTEAELTYADLLRAGRSVAGSLAAHGVMPGDKVALMLPTGAEYFASFVGVWLAGAVPVPIYPPGRPSQLEDHLRRQVRVLDNAGAVALVTVPEARSLARLVRAQVPTLTKVLVASELSTSGEERLPMPSRASDLALLQYTSGSTGAPKGVVLSHANLLANIRAMGRAAQVAPTDVFVSWLPLYHDMGLIGAWFTSLYFGIPLAVMAPTVFLARPARWLWAINEHRGTLSGGPNFAYELCLRATDGELDGLDLSSWRIAFNGAEPVSARTVTAFAERFARYGLRRQAITPVYGLAEVSVCLTFPPLGRGPLIDRVNRESLLRNGDAIPAASHDQEARAFVACGRPLAGHAVRVVDAGGRELGERQEGRIEFRGPSATSGYFRNAEATAELIRGDWLDTGDLGYLAAGEVYITGRVKDLIIRAGRNIHPEEIELAVGTIPGIRKGCVAAFGSPDPATGTERLVVLAETHQTAPEALVILRERINALIVDLLGAPPDDIALAPAGSVLKTSSGKIRRSATRSLYEEGLIWRRPMPAWLQTARLIASAATAQVGRTRRAVTAIAFNAFTWILVGTVGLPLVGLMIVLPSRRWRLAFARHAIRLLLHLSCTPLVVEGADGLRGVERFVVAANHPSYLDGFVLTAVLPPSITFVAGEVFAPQIFAGFILRRIGVYFVERADRDKSTADTTRLADLARAGANLVFFPEGGLSPLPGLRPFHLGAFVAATGSGNSVVPIAINGTRSILSPSRRFFRHSAVHVRIGQPIAPSGDGFDAAVRLARTAREAILAGCGEPDLE